MFGKARMMKLSGLLREGVEEAGKCECGGTMYEKSGCSECGGGMAGPETGMAPMYETEEEEEDKDKKKSDKKNEADVYELDEEGLQEIEESVKFRKMVRGELESMWASGQVFGKKATRRGGVTMGFKGIGFK